MNCKEREKDIDKQLYPNETSSPCCYYSLETFSTFYHGGRGGGGGASFEVVVCPRLSTLFNLESQILSTAAVM